MADKKISELTELTAPDGAEELVVNDSGTSKKITIDNLIADNGLSGDKIDGGTISNFTSTGIDDNATSTAITIDASENVGIGTISPDRALTVYTTAATDNNLLLKSGAANAYLTFADNGTTDQTGLSVRIGSSGNAMVFNTGGTTERMRIQSGGGISFNGDTAAANALDDYEEGTWTPQFRRDSGTWVNFATLNRATYTKIGNRVFFDCFGYGLTFPDGTSYIRMRGLPFTPSLSEQSATINLRKTVSSPPKEMFLDILASNQSYIFTSDTGAGTDAYSYIDSGTYVVVSGSYTV